MATITTGSWGVENGVLYNPNAEKGTYIKNLDKKTFMLEFAEQNYNTIFMASWDAHADTYQNEIKYVKDNNVSMEFYGFGEYGKYTNKKGEELKINDNDIHEKLLSCVTERSKDEKDVIFCIYDWADHNGHNTGFTNTNKHYVNAVRTNDALMYEVIKNVEARSNYQNEDLLIILTADHGGIKTWHGEQNPECRTTFIVTNKNNLVKKEYFGKNYDGYKEN